VIGTVAGSSILLVGQAPGPREAVEGRPFAFTAGRRLFGWFATLGVDEESFRRNVSMAAVIRCFPGRASTGGDRVPSAEEIERCAPHLDREIALLRPRLVIALGTLASGVLLGKTTLASIVGTVHCARRGGSEFDVVALPHPSGRSTWLNRKEHEALFQRSLELIGSHPAWRATFGAEMTGR
jgi:uracil-DNA glycosylase